MKLIELSDKDGKAEYKMVSGDYSINFKINYNLTPPSVMVLDLELNDVEFYKEAAVEAKNKIRQKLNKH